MKIPVCAHYKFAVHHYVADTAGTWNEVIWLHESKYQSFSLNVKHGDWGHDSARCLSLPRPEELVGFDCLIDGEKYTEILENL